MPDSIIGEASDIDSAVGGKVLLSPEAGQPLSSILHAAEPELFAFESPLVSGQAFNSAAPIVQSFSADQFEQHNVLYVY